MKFIILLFALFFLNIKNMKAMDIIQTPDASMTRSLDEYYLQVCEVEFNLLQTYNNDTRIKREMINILNNPLSHFIDIALPQDQRPIDSDQVTYLCLMKNCKIECLNGIDAMSGHMLTHLQYGAVQKNIDIDNCWEAHRHYIELYCAVLLQEKKRLKEKKGERVKCRICNNAFNKNYGLSMHPWTHVSKKPCICEGCGNGFLSECFKKQHLAKCLKNKHAQTKPFSRKRKRVELKEFVTDF